MQLSLSTLIGKVRIALDEQLGADVDSDFSAEFDAEITQALQMACLQLLRELPDDYLLPTTVGETGLQLHTTKSDGSGMVSLPTDFVRLLSFKLRSWSSRVSELTDARSELGHMQGSRWTRGTPQKPVCMLGVSSGGYRMMEYYTAGKDANEASYDHHVEYLSYVGSPTVSNGVLSAGLSDDCEVWLIYRAAGLVMEGKQNAELAERFLKLSVPQ